MRPEVERLVNLGQLPAEGSATVEQIDRIELEFRAIAPPLSDCEARALVRLFGPDGCFGVASSLIHLIETAPGWPLRDCLVDSENEFVVSLRDRARGGGFL
jgi:hypothetical protein